MNEALIDSRKPDFELDAIDAEARRVAFEIARHYEQGPRQRDYEVTRAVLRQRAYRDAIKPVIDVISFRMSCTFPTIRYRYEKDKCVIETSWPEMYPTKDEQTFIDAMRERYSK